MNKGLNFCLDGASLRKVEQAPPRRICWPGSKKKKMLK
jgi:hypothetical protein